MAGKELEFIREAFDGNWLSQYGPDVDELEKGFAELLGNPCVSLNSGTSAIHLGLKALGVGEGDEVVVPSLTFIATGFPVLYLGARPVIVDSESASWNVDVDLLEAWIRKRVAVNRPPRAVVVVHLYGQIAPMDRIVGFCSEFGIPVLEDAAHALGGSLNDGPVGTLGDVGIFSLNGNKTISASSGGILTARDPTIVEKVRFWSRQACRSGGEGLVRELGFNYRLSNVLAAIGRGQLEVLFQRIQSRREVAERYREAFSGVPSIEMMPMGPNGDHTCWLSCLRVRRRDGLKGLRDELIQSLADRGIEARAVFKPLQSHPVFDGHELVGGSVGEEISREGICLPSSSSLSLEAQRTVIENVLNHLRQRSGF